MFIGLWPSAKGRRQEGIRQLKAKVTPICHQKITAGRHHSHLILEGFIGLSSIFLVRSSKKL